MKNVSNTYWVKTEEAIYECTARGKLKQEVIKPVVGDNVEIESINKTQGVINEVLNRSSFMKRPKVSNITQIIFVISSKMPKPNLLMLDKWLAFAEFSNIKPVIVINKIDLSQKEADRINEIYSKVGYKVILTDGLNKKGLDELKQILKNNTSAFAGQSGVGKSTLANQLIGKDLTQTGEISKKNKMGKNTTTEITLYEIEKDTYLLDTPGFQTMDVFEIESQDLEKYFIDFKPYIKNCEFVRMYSYKRGNVWGKRSIKTR